MGLKMRIGLTMAVVGISIPIGQSSYCYYCPYGSTYYTPPPPSYYYYSQPTSYYYYSQPMSYYYHPNAPTPPSKSQLSKGSLMGIITGAVAFVYLLILGFLIIRKKRNYIATAKAQVSAGNSEEPPEENILPGMRSTTLDVSIVTRSQCIVFTYEELMKASNMFSDHNLLGHGSFGDVHRGTLPNGIEVAIKQLDLGSSQRSKEFKTEVEIISRVHHNHLVSLVGYCVSKSRKLLVYELVPNGTLESHLHHGKSESVMVWWKRMKVALGFANGLAYLHEECNPKIIHGDITAANILLDYEFKAKVADFGLGKEIGHAKTRIVGTFGYLAPEYLSSGKPTDKSDVYSFGVILLELITGRKPSIAITDNKSLVDWARPLLSEALANGNCHAIVDQKLLDGYNHEELIRVIRCCAACVHHSALDRPSMSRVVRMLEGLVPVDEPVDELKQDLLQPNRSSTISSTSLGYESSHQSNSGSRTMQISGSY